MQFDVIVAPGIRDMFVGRIVGMILSGRISVGDRLPSERELGEQMRVSKTVIHAGLKDLERIEDGKLCRPEQFDQIPDIDHRCVFQPCIQRIGRCGPEGLTVGLEGEIRPGHFRGVATVIAKLFNAVRPDRAYFGQKDAQQAAVIRQMTTDLDFPIEIVVCPTIREADGLAMSSRNSYLNTEERKVAPILFRALSAAKTAYKSGEREAESLRRVMRDFIISEPLARLQYVSCANYDTLEELIVVQNKALLSMAVFLGKTRLIDNIVIGDQVK